MDFKDCYPLLLDAVSMQNVLPLTSRCNLGCIFCSHRQNPTEIKTCRLPHLPLQTVLELSRFLSPEKKIIVGESATRIDEGEPFTYPQLLPALQALRKMHPKSLLALTTNGTLLSPEVVNELAGLSPLELTVSLNSVTARGRGILLTDPEPGRAPAAVALLAEKGIPFHGSLVAMPHLVGFDDIVETVRFLADHGALTIRVFLPGYTAQAPAELRFPLSVWDEVVDMARALTGELGMPVIPEPAVPDDLHAEVYGVMRGTPAYRAGVLSGDVILSVGGRAARTRVEAFNLARKAVNPVLRVKRGGKEQDIVVHKKRGQTPGFVMLFDFDTARLDDVQAQISRRRASAPLFLVSQFGEKAVRQALALSGLPDFAVHPVVNTFFGGSIKSSGLLVLPDLLAAARDARSGKPCDLVLVPGEAFDRTGRDLIGRDLVEMEDILGLPVQAV